MTIDADGKLGKKWNPRPEFNSTTPHRRFKEVFARRDTFPIFGVIRANVLKKTPLLGNYPEHDRPLLAELSLYGRFYELPEFLFLEREHKQRSVRLYDFRDPHKAISWYDPKMAGKLIFPAFRLLAEYLAGIYRAPLSLKNRIPCFIAIAKWMIDYRLDFVRDLIIAGSRIPVVGEKLTKAYKIYLKSKWINRTKNAAKNLEMVVSIGDTIILVDQASFEPKVFDRWTTIPFLEREGEYWGYPPDDATAIGELDRLHKLGANFIVFTWPAFWWLDHYAEFHRYLRSQFVCVLKNEHLIVFNLKSKKKQ
jgi:hypothetical protein